MSKNLHFDINDGILNCIKEGRTKSDIDGGLDMKCYSRKSEKSQRSHAEHKLKRI